MKQPKTGLSPIGTSGLLGIKKTESFTTSTYSFLAYNIKIPAKKYTFKPPVRGLKDR